MNAKNKSIPGRSAAASFRIPMHDDIAARARILWEERGRIAGQDTAIWLEAEAQLWESAEKRSRSRSASRIIFDEDRQLNDTVDKILAEIIQPTGDRSPTSL